MLTRILIRNKRYKPKAAYQTIQDYLDANSNAACEVAFAPYTSYLNVEEEFKSRFIGYVDTTIVAQIPAAKVVAIPNGRAHTDNNFSIAIIGGDNRLIGELSYDLQSSDPSKNSIFRQNAFNIPKKYDGNVFSMLIGEGGIVNYSHFLIDSVSRIAMLKKVGWYEKIDWFLVPSQKYDFHRDILHELGIDKSKIIAGDVNNHVQADTLFATTYVRHYEHIPSWCCNFLRQEFLQNSIQKYNCPYVYISRNDSAKRRVLNEPELFKMLTKYDFQSFELSKLSFTEKVSLFANAKIIIATIGAGQANLVFARENTNVIELMAKDFTQPFFNDLANKVGLHYDYLICKSDARAKNFKQGEKLNLIVNISEIEKRLKTIFEKTNKKNVNETALTIK